MSCVRVPPEQLFFLLKRKLLGIVVLPCFDLCRFNCFHVQASIVTMCSVHVQASTVTMCSVHVQASTVCVVYMYRQVQ